MEAKLNIANILKNKPKGTKLYTDAFGELKLERVKVNEVDAIYTKNKTSTLYCFYNDGKYNKNGEPVLVPSKEMRDWSKFAWKKGDVLVSNDYSTEVIFDKWYDDTYTNFYGKHSLDSEDKNNIKYNDAFLCTTGRYSLEDKDATKTYINAIEERLSGKLNRETLEIEKQPEFKDGDILYVKTKKLGSEYIIINKLSKEAKTAFYVAYNLSSKKIFWNLIYFVCCDKEISILRQATDYEKSQLFDALAKKNKTWDSEKKAIVDLKPKWTPKPFDKIVAFEELSEEWVCDMFSHYSKNYEDKEIIVAIGGCTYFKALPFNEETAKLIGTSNDWKE